MTSPFEVVALAASAGGLNALTQVLAALPEDFPAALVVVQHLDRRHRSVMADILSRRTRLAVKEAALGDQLAVGRALIAPPDRHLLVNADRSISLTQTELVHFVRPSADLLFESVAAGFRDRAIACARVGDGCQTESRRHSPERGEAAQIGCLPPDEPDVVAGRVFEPHEIRPWFSWLFHRRPIG